MERKQPRTWREAQAILNQLVARGPGLLDHAESLPVIAGHGRVMEAVVLANSAHLVVREPEGRCFWRMELPHGEAERATVDDYLQAQERLVPMLSTYSLDTPTNVGPSCVDFRPCFASFPRRSGPPPSLDGPWPDSLRHLLSQSLAAHEFAAVHAALRQRLAARGIHPPAALHASDTARPEREHLSQLVTLLATQPLLGSLVMVSVHGWFSQVGVLGKPDTGGQVTYVLEQARCLEQAMRAQHEAAGLADPPRVVIVTRQIPDAEGTVCDQRLEKIEGTVDSWILRVPFRQADGSLVRTWLSRFAIVPYLETFAAEAAEEVERFLGRTPDLVVGHYTDGNLVAMHLQRRWRNLHAACVHLLERTKHRASDLLAVPEPHASVAHEQLLQQSLADVWGYNSADFIVSSTRREVQFEGPSESPDACGMLETYEWFTLPGRYRVTGGIDPRLARHYVVPPGVDEDCFRVDERPGDGETTDAGQTDPVAACLRRLGIADDLPRLSNADRPWIFTIARLDPAKNIAGLVDAYGRSDALRGRANLLIVSSTNDWRTARDEEERREAKRIEALIQSHGLAGRVWWLAARLSREVTGQLFRAVARSRGIFAQPARFETFGLTVLEAMACGLPVVATRHGGPAEILREGIDGELADPDDPADFAAALLRLLENPARWQACAEAGPRRIAEAYAWHHHGRALLALAGLHAALRIVHPERHTSRESRTPPFPRLACPE